MHTFVYCLLSGLCLLAGCGADTTNDADTVVNGYEVIYADRSDYDPERVEKFVSVFRQLAEGDNLDQQRVRIYEDSKIVKKALNSPGLRIATPFRGFDATFAIPFRFQGAKIICMIQTPSGDISYGLYHLPQDMLPYPFK